VLPSVAEREATAKWFYYWLDRKKAYQIAKGDGIDDPYG
jgi:hypothetical protein